MTHLTAEELRRKITRELPGWDGEVVPASELSPPEKPEHRRSQPIAEPGWCRIPTSSPIRPAILVANSGLSATPTPDGYGGDGDCPSRRPETNVVARGGRGGR